MQPASTPLDPTLHSSRVLEIKRKLLARTIGQTQAVDKLCGILETFFAGYNDPSKPVGVERDVRQITPAHCRKSRTFVRQFEQVPLRGKWKPFGSRSTIVR